MPPGKRKFWRGENVSTKDYNARKGLEQMLGQLPSETVKQQEDITARDDIRYVRGRLDAGKDHLNRPLKPKQREAYEQQMQEFQDRYGGTGFKSGGLVRGCGQAQRGFGKAMKRGK